MIIHKTNYHTKVDYTFQRIIKIRLVTHEAYLRYNIGGPPSIAHSYNNAIPDI